MPVIKPPVKFAIIGCGNIAQRHARHISKTGKLQAVCDILSQRARDLADQYNCRPFDNLSDLLRSAPEVDVVAICTPNGLHAEHTIASLEAGKHVLCEKPMALSVKDCREMVNTAKRTGKNLMIVKQNRFNPPVMALKQLLDENKLGKIFNIQLNCFWNRNEAYYRGSDWKGKRAMDGGPLFMQFSHFIDLLYWLAGPLKNASMIKRNFMHREWIEFEDTGGVLLEFENGAIGTLNFTLNSYEKNMEGSITLFGEKGTVKIGGQYLNTLEYQHIEDYRISDVNEHRPPNDYGFYQGSMSNHDKVYQNVIDVLTNDAHITVDGMEGMKTIEMIEKIYG